MILIDKEDYRVLFQVDPVKFYKKHQNKPSHLLRENSFLPLSLPKIDLGLTYHVVQQFETMRKQMTLTNNMVQDIMQPIRNQVNSIQAILTSLPKITLPEFDKEKLKEIAEELQYKYQLFFNELKEKGILPSFKFIDIYEEHFSEHGCIEERFIIEQFEKDFPEIKSSFYSHELFKEKYSYLELAIEDYCKEKYSQCTFLLFSAMDYTVVYSLLRKERGKIYYPLKSSLKEGLSDLDRAFIDYEYHIAFQKIAENYYKNDNNIEDPRLVNRNRLMHGTMDINNIGKIDCIKLFYLIESLVDIKIK